MIDAKDFVLCADENTVFNLKIDGELRYCKDWHRALKVINDHEREWHCDLKVFHWICTGDNTIVAILL